MEAYTGFAQVYDIFMDDTPYEEWCGYLVGLLEKYRAGTDIMSVRQKAEENMRVGCSESSREGIGNDSDVIYENLQQERNSVLDLGCGTGTLTELLARRGYDMIGIDNSQEMLQIAMDKCAESGLDILYLLQDMRSFELYGTVGAVVSVCDSINYLLEEEDVVETFRLVNNYLFPEGVFIFDFNTVYKYEVVIGEATIAENREKCSFIWENYYHETEEVNEYDLTIFVQEDETGIYRRFQETHYQRGYRLEQMQECLRRAGMEFVEALDADTHEAVCGTSERIYVVARKGKTDANCVQKCTGGLT